MANLQISSIQGKTLDPKSLRRDTRSLGRKIGDFFLTQNNLVIFSGFCTLAAGGLFLRWSWSVWPLALGTMISWFVGRRHYERRHLPLRLPMTAGITDYGDPSPGHFKFNKSKGIFFLGNSKSAEAEDGWGAGEEFWVADTDMRRHFLVFGSTGSGKTVTLVGMSYNSLAMGSGLIYVDPKADAKLVTQIYRLARFLGREEDVRVLNFMTGNRDQAAGTKRSNTVNPFAFGDATSLSDILSAMIPTSEGDNAIFSQRAVSLIKAIMPPLVEMRDRNERLLSVDTIREFLSFDKFIELGKRAHQGHFSDKVKSTMSAYLGSLGLKPDGEATSQKQGKPDNSKAVEQFQYASMYFTRAMDSLATDYGYIYNVLRGEVDYRDVFFNRRILVVLLPALEKNESEIALLGKLVLFAIKNALASGLGSRIEGTADETLGSRPSSSVKPMLLVLDEYAALQVKGFAEAATQGRSLGASCVFANQDLAGFMKASEAEAEQILANTRCQLFMYQGDMNKTMDYIVKKAGKAATMKTQGYAASPDSLVGTYADKQEAVLDMSERAVAADFLKLTEGEYFLVFDDKFVVGQAFFDPMMDPKGSDTMRVNRLLMISPPEHTQIALLATEGEALLTTLSDVIRGKKACPTDQGRPREAIASLIEANDLVSPMDGSPQELAICTLLLSLGRVGKEKGEKTGGGSSSGGGPPVRRNDSDAPQSGSEVRPQSVADPSPAEVSGEPPEPIVFDDPLSDLKSIEKPQDELDVTTPRPGDERHVVEDASTIHEMLTNRNSNNTMTAEEKLREIGCGGESYRLALDIERHISGGTDEEAKRVLDDWINRSMAETSYPRDGKEKDLWTSERGKREGRWDIVLPTEKSSTSSAPGSLQDELDAFLK